MEPLTISGMEFVIEDPVVLHSGPITYLQYVQHLQDMRDSLSSHTADVSAQTEWSTSAANLAIRRWRERAHSFNTKAKTMAFRLKSVTMEINS